MAAAVVLIVTTSGLSSAPVPPSGFEVETLATGLDRPTGFAFAPDGRIFITEKSGAVRIIKNGVLLPAPFLRLTDVNHYGDRGLHGIAVDPDFAQNGHVYLAYTFENSPGIGLTAPKTARLVRVTAQGDAASESSKVVLAGTVGGTAQAPSCEDYPPEDDCIPSDSPAHSVGALRFGPDGKLYMSIGDGAHFGYMDPRSMRAQDLDRQSGKVLRLNTDGSAPADNPYFNGDPQANRSKVWMYGLRYPFRFGFRPADGSMYIGDVGWRSWEEVDRGLPGSNFGWPCREGQAATEHSCTVPGAVDPLHAYSTAQGAAVIGGGFPGTSYPPEFRDSYFFADYVKDHIRRMVLNPDGTMSSVAVFITSAGGAVDLQPGPDGDLYYVAFLEGALRRIVHTVGNRRPVAEIGAAPTSGLAPLAVEFESSGSSDPDGDPLSFHWELGDGSGTSEASPTHTYASNGSYSATLKVSDPEGRFDIKSVAITVGNRAPAARIESPATSSLYTEGETIKLAGSGNDPEDGNLPASALHWQVILHHNVHTHLLEELEGANPSFIAPDHSAPDVHLEVVLAAMDSEGLTGSASINLYRDNAPDEEGQNLVPNASLELADPNIAGLPQHWKKGGFGTNQAVLGYPVSGFEGERAARIEVSQYTSGDRKWYFDPVHVTPGREYLLANAYRSNVSTKITVQFGRADGSYLYLDLGTVEASAAWKRLERRFTVPPDARTATVFHSIRAVGWLEVDAYWLGLPPSRLVSITSPAAGVVVSGSAVPLEAKPAEGAAGLVAGVVFLLDGLPVGAEDTQPPYTLRLDTLPLTDGVHLVAAKARDAGGQLHGSPEVRFVVLNQLPLSTNMIANPSVEVASASDPHTPVGWKRGRTGVHETVFTYPVPGIAGGNAVAVEMTAYTNGQARWYPADMPVVPGREYLFLDRYSANVSTTVRARFKLQDGSYFYPRLGQPGASAAWKQARCVFVAPAGAESVTLFHSLGAVGRLATDDFSLTAGGNLVRNPSAEIETSLPPGPLAWQKGRTGTHSAVFSYPAAGVAGGRGLGVEIGSYTSGDAKWYVEDIPVEPGRTYVIAEYYQASAPTTMKVRVKRPSGTFYYPLLGLLDATPSWRRAEFQFVAPGDAASITVFHYLAAVGKLTIDELSIRLKP